MTGSARKRRSVIAMTNVSGVRGTTKGGAIASDTRADVAAIARRRIPLPRIRPLRILRPRKTVTIETNLVTGVPGNVERADTARVVVVVVVPTKVQTTVVAASIDGAGRGRSLRVGATDVGRPLDATRSRQQRRSRCPSDVVLARGRILYHSRDDYGGGQEGAHG
jgi:hypothetical protein